MEIQVKAALKIDEYTGQMEEQSQAGPLVSYLVVWVEHAAVNIVVVTPEHSDQLSCVEGIHCHRAAARHKHKLWAAAM